MDTVIIGSGNVASVLGRKILASGHRILQVAARNEVKGKHLADQLGADHAPDLSQINRNATLYIVAISDDALPGLQGILKLERAVIVHTAGSVSKEVLKGVCNNYGVLYPLQTLKANSDQIPEFPLLVDANTADTLTLIRDFAETITDQVVEADDDYRKKIHLAAVVSGNFSNHLYALVQDYCNANKLDFTLLLPQIKEIVGNLKSGHAAARQTGPALRNDVETLNKHMEMLNAFPELSEIYELMTALILNYHSEK
ncbi:MAG TPA: Rossmann-like and DUF2520 domain-containing protein [Chitinophagaceae bacterium]|nr:Rossmann-like and DUF2520 domain-containing protein [Chitinophagaceae bacterium]